MYINVLTTQPFITINRQHETLNLRRGLSTYQTLTIDKSYICMHCTKPLLFEDLNIVYQKYVKKQKHYLFILRSSAAIFLSAPGKT